MSNADPLIERYERLSIGDTTTWQGHEWMWDGGQWAISPDEECGRVCHYATPYGFVPEADCPVHDVPTEGICHDHPREAT